MYRSLIVALTAAVVLALAVTAASARPKQEPVTLTFLGANTTQAAFEVLIANFNRVYPNIRIQATYLPTATTQSLLLTQLAAGNAPDIFRLNVANSGPVGVWRIAKEGTLLDLSKSPWVKRIPVAQRRMVMVGKKTYGYQAVAITNAIMYNRDIFRELGLRVPTRTTELREICRRVAAAGKTPMIIQGADQTRNQIIQAAGQAFVYSTTPNWNALRNAKKVRYHTGLACRISGDRKPEGRRLFQPRRSGHDAQCSIRPNGKWISSYVGDGCCSDWGR